MTVTDVQKDLEARSMTITAEFDASVKDSWQLWENPRLLERWWGPPTYPATVLEHDLSPGGRVSYVMTGPEGERHGGWWRVLSVDPPHTLEFEDGFATESGEPNPDLPITRVRVSLHEPAAGRTHMSIESTFPSREAMEQLLAMGMDEGMREAMGQMDALLTEV